MRRKPSAIRSLGTACAIAALLSWSAVPLRGETLENIGQTRQFHVCANPKALPYTSEESDTPGFQLDLQRAIAQLMGWKATVTWLHNRLAADRLGCGGFMGRRLDESGEPIVAQRNDHPVSHRITSPYAGSGFVVVLPVGSRTQFANLPEFAAYEPLREGKPLGVALGSPVAARLEQAGVRTATFLYQEQIIEGVLSGDLAAGLVARENAAWFLRRKPGTFAQFDLFRVDADFRWNVGIDLRGADTTLVATINQIIARFVRDGTLNRMMARYGIVYQPPFPER